MGNRLGCEFSEGRCASVKKQMRKGLPLVGAAWAVDVCGSKAIAAADTELAAKNFRRVIENLEVIT